ncbi:RHS repeat-associated core domain-containing protein [Pseudomonas sp. NPDC007930]|uniref:RHS repeat-associated core domain-containing protein n=1 Tax=Pseudomonas sp. NPDC007930 TaxID=3364417 RepID=UPI0036E66832
MLIQTDTTRTVLGTFANGRAALPVTPWGYVHGQRSGPGLQGEWLEGGGRYLLGNGYRALLGTLGRFNAPDNLSPFGAGGINAYAFCRADPVNRVDPSGHVHGLAQAVLAPFEALMQNHLIAEELASWLDPKAMVALKNTSRTVRTAITGTARFKKLGRAAAALGQDMPSVAEQYMGIIGTEFYRPPRRSPGVMHDVFSHGSVPERASLMLTGESKADHRRRMPNLAGMSDRDQAQRMSRFYGAAGDVPPDWAWAQSAIDRALPPNFTGDYQPTGLQVRALMDTTRQVARQVSDPFFWVRNGLR